MVVTNITSLRNNMARYLDSVLLFDEQITATTKNGNIVIIKEEDYNSLIETLYLQTQNGLIKKIKDGEKEDISKMSSYNPETF